MTESLVNKSS